MFESFRKRHHAIKFDSIEPPWEPSRKAIYAHLKEHQQGNGIEISEAGIQLPDEPEDDGNQIRFVAGGMDGAFGHHGAIGGNQDLAKSVAISISSFLASGTSTALRNAYELIVSSSTLDYIDQTLEILGKNGALQSASFYGLAKWLLKNSPDREAVKIALGFLGTCATDEDIRLCLEVGAHDEFTLYAAVAITNIKKGDADVELWELGRAVHGWGRVHIVERLAKTNNAAIKR